MRSELRKRGRRDEQKRSWSLLGRSDGGKRSELSWRRGRKRERDGHEEGRRTERRREAVTIYVKRRGKETNEKNDDGSPHSLLIVRSVGDGGSGGHIIHYHLQLRGRAAVAVPPSLDDCGAGFIIDEHFIDSSKARRSLDLFAVAKII